METITLGMTELKVSRIAYGTWQLGGDWGTFDERDAIDAIRRARDLGVNLFDTAQAYGFGASERLLAKALRDDLDRRRDEIIVATKGGLRMTSAGLIRDASPAWLRQGVEDSLRALGVDVIDLYQVHWPDPKVPLVETAGALHDLVDEGKIRHVGVSNYDVAQMSEFARSRPVETLQPPYHLFRRDIEDEVLPYAMRNDIGVLVYGPLAHGLLTGALDETMRFAPDDWRSKSPLFQGETYRRNLAVVRDLAGLARDHGVRVSQLAIAWTLAHPAVSVAIVGSRRASHIAESVAAADVRLDEADLARIDQIMAGAVAVAGPSPEREGSSMPATVTLSMIAGPSVGAEFVFTERTTAIAGRASDCNLRIVEDGPRFLARFLVSRHHCLFDINPPEVRVRDLGSLNGTHVNGVEIGRRQPDQTPEEGARLAFRDRDLADGDQVRLGETVLQVGVVVPARCAAQIPVRDVA